MPRLRHGLGAEATVLTKKITSEGGLPDKLQALVTRSSSAATGTIESKHRSKIILIEFLEVDKRLTGLQLMPHICGMKKGSFFQRGISPAKIGPRDFY
jgi:hypothetical protein